VIDGANIFLLLLCCRCCTRSGYTRTPPDVGQAVHAIHTMCEVPTACSACHRWSAIDELHRVDDTCGPVAFGAPHVPPSVWRDHDDTSGRRHDPWSSH
jgi:hypothetical protein